MSQTLITVITCGVTLICKPDTTEEQVCELKAMIKAKGLRTVEDD